ncbi:unnamed protein product, partial [marine sediment metagenome]
MNRKHKLTAIVAIFVAMAFVMPGATVFASDKNLETDICPDLILDGATFDPGDILFNYNVETSGDNQCLGVEFDGTYFYISGGGGVGGSGINKLHFFQADGTYIASVDQGTSSGWGWRDIGYDGNHMYS